MRPLTSRQFAVRFITAIALTSAIPAAHAASDDSAFLACAQHSDRGQRIACLEDALETALQSQAPATAGPSTTTSVAPAAAPRSTIPAAPAAAPTIPAPATSPSAASSATAAAPAQDEAGPSLLDRVRNFGRRNEASVSADANGSERLQDTITELDRRNDVWIVTLSSGQVWRQEIPRTLNLRVGDEIEIYQGGFGNGFLLSTPRLSGTIRVERVR